MNYKGKKFPFLLFTVPYTYRSKYKKETMDQCIQMAFIVSVPKHTLYGIYKPKTASLAHTKRMIPFDGEKDTTVQNHTLHFISFDLYIIRV